MRQLNRYSFVKKIAVGQKELIDRPTNLNFYGLKKCPQRGAKEEVEEIY